MSFLSSIGTGLGVMLEAAAQAVDNHKMVHRAIVAELDRQRPYDKEAAHHYVQYTVVLPLLQEKLETTSLARDVVDLSREVKRIRLTARAFVGLDD